MIWENTKWHANYTETYTHHVSLNKILFKVHHFQK